MNVPLASAHVRGGGRLRDEPLECPHRRLVEVHLRTFSAAEYFVMLHANFTVLISQSGYFQVASISTDTIRYFDFNNYFLSFDYQLVFKLKSLPRSSRKRHAMLHTRA